MCHFEHADRLAPCLPKTFHPHLPPLRAHVPETSSDFALLCMCAHSDATFYEANSSRTAARIGRWPAPIASGDCRLPSAVLDLIIDPITTSTTPRAMFRGVPPPIHIPRWPTHSLCADHARQGGCTQARRRRTEVERSRSSVTARGGSSRATGGACARGLSRRHGLSRPPAPQPGVPAGRIYAQPATAWR